MRRGASIVELGQHGGLQSQHGNQRRRHVYHPHGIGHRAVDLAVFHHIDDGHDGDVKCIQSYHIDHHPTITEALIVGDDQYHDTYKRDIHHQQDAPAHPVSAQLTFPVLSKSPFLAVARQQETHHRQEYIIHSQSPEPD